MAALAAAGLPMIQYDNTGSIVAMQSLTRPLGIGVFCKSIAELGAQLRDRGEMERLRSNVWRERPRFTFDFHADSLLDFFRTVIARKQPSAQRQLVTTVSGTE
jgi:hypothetical protein